jgi:hypothetical protein
MLSRSAYGCTAECCGLDCREGGDLVIRRVNDDLEVPLLVKVWFAFIALVTIVFMGLLGWAVVMLVSWVISK